MMRHFVAFALLLFVLEISGVILPVMLPKKKLCGHGAPWPPCFLNNDHGCRARCLKQLNCQNAHCEKVKGKSFSWRCVCEDCPGGQQKNLRGEILGPVPN
ncbi:unnamed protein product [Cylicocyclus nassatus]|uniref:Knottin scorpion toxin-like domain-containing protein n=1 Tax=Cylicocyclus nassatus TaxID=53992 RepID=A0AA36MFT2_CYLNA|nr:unnamed protein product [Cylicocyclus nassatus]